MTSFRNRFSLLNNKLGAYREVSALFIYTFRLFKIHEFLYSNQTVCISCDWHVGNSVGNFAFHIPVQRFGQWGGQQREDQTQLCHHVVDRNDCRLDHCDTDRMVGNHGIGWMNSQYGELTTRFAHLNRRAGHRPIRTIDATIPFLRFQQCATALAVIKPLAGVGRHGFNFIVTALRAGNR